MRKTLRPLKTVGLFVELLPKTSPDRLRPTQKRLFFVQVERRSGARGRHGVRIDGDAQNRRAKTLQLAEILEIESRRRAKKSLEFRPRRMAEDAMPLDDGLRLRPARNAGPGRSPALPSSTAAWSSGSARGAERMSARPIRPAPPRPGASQSQAPRPLQEKNAGSRNPPREQHCGAAVMRPGEQQGAWPDSMKKTTGKARY